MHRILTICKLNLKLLTKSYQLQVLYLSLWAFSALIFFLSKGLEHINDELQVRIEYTYTLSYYFLAFATCFIACFMLRNQINSKTIQLLCSYPVKRLEVFFGKLLCLGIFSFLGLLSIIGSIYIYSLIYIKTFPPQEQQKAINFYSISRAETFPTKLNLHKLANEKMLDDIKRNKLKKGDINSQVRQDYFNQAYQEHKVIQPNGTQKWTFKIDGNKVSHSYVLLRVKFLEKNKRRLVGFTFSITHKNYQWKHKANIYASTKTYIPIPTNSIPKNEPFTIKVKAQNPKEIVFDNNLALLYPESTLAKNICKAIFFQFFHLLIISTIGLLAGTALSIAVAIFCTGTLFMLGSGIKFFGSELQIFAKAKLENYSFIENILWFMVQVGVLISTCLNTPAVIEKISKGLSVPFVETCQSWLIYCLIYLTIFNIIAIIYFNKKELDKTVY